MNLMNDKKNLTKLMHLEKEQKYIIKKAFNLSQSQTHTTVIKNHSHTVHNTDQRIANNKTTTAKRRKQQAYQELLKFLVVPDHALSAMPESRVLGDHILGLPELGVDPGQLVDRRGDPEARHVGRQQLVVERVCQNLGLVPRILPVHHSVAAALDHHSHLALVRIKAVAGAVLQVLGRFVGLGGGDHGVSGGGDVVYDVTVVAVEDGAREPLVGGLRHGGGVGGRVEVQEIAAIVIVVVVVVCVGVVRVVIVLGLLGPEQRVVEPIGCGLEALLLVG